MEGCFLFFFINEIRMAPAKTPQIAERNITNARDASNFQTRKVITTGIAFCTENMITTAKTINNKISLDTVPSTLQGFQLYE
jgi:hypothetical protein